MTDELQFQTVICSLPEIWEHVRVKLTHSADIKTFDNAARCVVEEDYLLIQNQPMRLLWLLLTRKEHQAPSAEQRWEG